MVYENELWHSFLLRSQIMYNLSNCRNIISKHGALRYDAFPRFELIDMYICIACRIYMTFLPLEMVIY